MIARVLHRLADQRAYLRGWLAWLTDDPRHYYASQPRLRVAFDAGVFDAIRFDLWRRSRSDETP